MHKIKLLAGSSCVNITNEVSSLLGYSVSKAFIGYFSDGESRIEILDNIVNSDIYIIFSTCFPVNNHLMELMLLIDTCKRSFANRITAIIPYFGYSRQDRRIQNYNVPISAKVVMDMLNGVGLNRIITMDIHSEQIQGFCNIPIFNMSSSNIIADYIKNSYDNTPMIVSPDMGGVARARSIATLLNCDLSIIEKKRQKANESEVMNIVGNVFNKNCLIIDDIVDTAGSLCKAATALIQKGAKNVSAFCTHSILSGSALTTINNSSLDKLITTNSIPLNILLNNPINKIEVLSISSLIAKTILQLL